MSAESTHTPLAAAQVRELIAESREKVDQSCPGHDNALEVCGGCYNVIDDLVRRQADALESALGAVERVSAVIDAPYPAAPAAHNDALVQFRAEIRRALTGDQHHG